MSRRRLLPFFLLPLLLALAAPAARAGTSHHEVAQPDVTAMGTAHGLIEKHADEIVGFPRSGL